MTSTAIDILTVMVIVFVCAIRLRYLQWSIFWSACVIPYFLISRINQYEILFFDAQATSTLFDYHLSILFWTGLVLVGFVLLLAIPEKTE